ncbi:hypothetical protein VKS41_002544 [Umbelopsis sp. WA50703]
MLKSLCLLLLACVVTAFNTSALPSLDQVGTCIATCVLNTGHSVCGSQFTLNDASVQCACTNPTFNSTVHQCVSTNHCPASNIAVVEKAYQLLCQNQTVSTASLSSALPSSTGSASATLQTSMSPAAASADAAAGSSKEFPFSGSAVAVFVVLTVGTIFF